MRLALVSAILALAPLPILAADREAGRQLFARDCVACHSIACDRSGPRLGGLLGRPAGSVAEYGAYSDAIENADVVWTEETLDAFLADPAGLIPNNGMIVVGAVEDAEERANLIAFLKAPDEGLDLCF